MGEVSVQIALKMTRLMQASHRPRSSRNPAARTVAFSKWPILYRIVAIPLFEVKRASAQTLMKAIGGIQNVGGTHLVDREVLLEFLDQTIAADDVSGAVRSRREEAAPPPQPKRMKFSLPGELKSVMAADLHDGLRRAALLRLVELWDLRKGFARPSRDQLSGDRVRAGDRSLDHCLVT